MEKFNVISDDDFEQAQSLSRFKMESEEFDRQGFRKEKAKGTRRKKTTVPPVVVTVAVTV